VDVYVCVLVLVGSVLRQAMELLRNMKQTDMSASTYHVGVTNVEDLTLGSFTCWLRLSGSLQNSHKLSL
jgi:hypothetical protein